MEIKGNKWIGVLTRPWLAWLTSPRIGLARLACTSQQPGVPSIQFIRQPRSTVPRVKLDTDFGPGRSSLVQCISPLGWACCIWSYPFGSNWPVPVCVTSKPPSPVLGAGCVLELWVLPLVMVCVLIGWCVDCLAS